MYQLLHIQGSGLASTQVKDLAGKGLSMLRGSVIIGKAGDIFAVALLLFCYHYVRECVRS